jgi:glycosyltransferase involved in cell wall biosynthesis
MADSGNSRSGGSVRLAYLCNLYPAVSHSFVRREIAGVEQAGHEVRRFSLRPSKTDLKDQADLAEAARTEVVLAQGVLRLAFAAALLFVARPARTFRAARAACRLSGPGFDQKVRHLAYWLEAAWLVRRLDHHGIEHLHAHFGTNPAAVALIVRAWGGPPFSFTAHGPDEFDAPVTLSLSQKVAAARFAVAISSFGRSQLMRWSRPSEWSKIKVIRCGVDEGFLEAVRQIPSGSTEFLCVARLSAQKGLPLLIAACDRLRRSGVEFTLTLIGDGELRQALEEDIRARTLENHIILAGTCSSAEIRQHLLRARTFVLPSFAEGLPVVIMEALALARPVITTAIAGIPELVNDECGWLIPAGSEDDLVGAMTAALRASPDELATKGAVGRERVKQLHDARRNAALIAAAVADPQAAICTR